MYLSEHHKSDKYIKGERTMTFSTFSNSDNLTFSIPKPTHEHSVVSHYKIHEYNQIESICTKINTPIKNSNELDGNRLLTLMQWIINHNLDIKLSEDNNGMLVFWFTSKNEAAHFENILREQKRIWVKFLKASNDAIKTKPRYASNGAAR